MPLGSWLLHLCRWWMVTEDRTSLDGVAEVRLQMLWLIKRQEMRLLISISQFTSPICILVLWLPYPERANEIPPF
jgi:hypothetical protein